MVTLGHESEPPTKRCFDNFRDAMAYASAGQITDAPLTGAAAIRNPIFAQQIGLGYELVNHENTVAGCCVILSIEYEHADFRGNTLTYRAETGCDRDRDIDYGISFMSADWNDEISSYVTLNRCAVKHFEHQYEGGASTDWSTGDDYMGVMNDATSSLRWR